MIEKIQVNPDNYKINMFFYQRARDAMLEVVQQLYDRGYRDIYIPGYIGWSPREGSGIFDPLNRIDGLKRHYYKMTSMLEIDVGAFKDDLEKESILLIVNYFGFRDKNVDMVIKVAREKECVIIEDNAHGFYTFFCNGTVGTDITFFSLHKMFPFQEGGSLLILNNKVGIVPKQNLRDFSKMNPFIYDINGIAEKRKQNFKVLSELIEGNETYFVPLRNLEDVAECVPQTFPIVLKRGNRNRIYELMNKQGFGVVSLYHTMIEELRTEEHRQACWLAQHILNLPVHQDCDSFEYPQMIETLKKACLNT